MNATDVIGWTTSDGSAYCLDHEPTARPGSSLTWGPVFGSDAASFEDGGLDCDRCGAVIVESDTCRACDRSLRDAHDEYTFGTVTVSRCRPHMAATVRVRERCGAPWSVAVTETVVPFDCGADSSPEDALIAACAAYAGKVATFDVLAVEEIPGW